MQRTRKRKRTLTLRKSDSEKLIAQLDAACEPELAAKPFQTEASARLLAFNSRQVGELTTAALQRCLLVDSGQHYNAETDTLEESAWPQHVSTNGVVLCAAAGLGKTRIASRFVLEKRAERKRVLIVCPEGLVFKWRAEMLAVDPTCEPLMVTEGNSYNRLRISEKQRLEGVVLILAAGFTEKPCYKSYDALRKDEELLAKCKEAWTVLCKLEQVLRDIEATRSHYAPMHPTVMFAQTCGFPSTQAAQSLVAVLHAQKFKRDPRVASKHMAALAAASAVPSPSMFERGIWSRDFDALLAQYVDLNSFKWDLAVMDEPKVSCKHVGRKKPTRDAFVALPCLKLVLVPHVAGDEHELLALIGIDFPFDATNALRASVLRATLRAHTVNAGSAEDLHALQRWATRDTVELDPSHIDVPASVELLGCTAATAAAEKRKAEVNLITCDAETLIATAECTVDRARFQVAEAVAKDRLYLTQYHDVLSRQLKIMRGCRGNERSPEAILQQLTQLDDLNLTIDNVVKRLASNCRLMAAQRRTALQIYLGIFGKEARQEASCTVCLEQQSEGLTLLVTNCGHVFCDGCIAGWRKTGGPRADSCPTCREEVVAVCVMPRNTFPDPTTIPELRAQLTLHTFGAKIAWLSRELSSLEAQLKDVLVVCWTNDATRYVAHALKRTCDCTVVREYKRSGVAVINGSDFAWNQDMPHVDWVVLTSCGPHDASAWVLRMGREKPVRITTLALREPLFESE